MNEVDFWNDRAAAQRVIDEYQQIKAQTDHLGKVIAQFEDTKIGYELAREGDDEELLLETDEQLFALSKK